MTEVAGSTFDYRVRFDEAGPDGRVRSSSLLRYAQDVAWLDSERRGFDRSWYRDRGLAWVVRAVEMDIAGPIGLGQTLSITTQVIGQRKVWARRRTDVHAPGGALLAWLHTDWVLVDDAGRLVRVPAIFAEVFRVAVATLDPLRVQPGPVPAGARRMQTTVRAHELDPMGHVNNAAYVDWFEETLQGDGDASRDDLPTRRIPRHYELEYVTAAAKGDDLVAETWPDGTGWTHRLVRGRDDRELFRARLR